MAEVAMQSANVLFRSNLALAQEHFDVVFGEGSDL